MRWKRTNNKRIKKQVGPYISNLLNASLWSYTTASNYGGKRVKSSWSHDSSILFGFLYLFYYIFIIHILSNENICSSLVRYVHEPCSNELFNSEPCSVPLPSLNLWTSNFWGLSSFEKWEMHIQELLQSSRILTWKHDVQKSTRHRCSI